MSFEKIEKENLTNDLIQQDIINGFKNDSHITTNIILIIQITDKGLRALVPRPLSYFTSIRISDIIEV